MGRGIEDGVLIDYGMLSAEEVEAVERALERVDERAVIALGRCVPDGPAGTVDASKVEPWRRYPVPEVVSEELERWRYHEGSWRRVVEGEGAV